MPAAPQPLPVRETVDVEINGWTYHITKLGALTGNKLMARIIRVIGPSFDELRGDDGEPVTKLCAALKDEEFDYVCNTLSKETRVSPVEQPDVEWLLKDRFDTHFSGHYGSMVLWVKACLEANYGNFLDEAGINVEEIKGLLALAMSKSTESPSAGASSASSVRAGAA